ncbi:MAG: hypothetical protein QM614_10165 [Ottowia sp.]
MSELEKAAGIGAKVNVRGLSDEQLLAELAELGVPLDGVMDERGAEALALLERMRPVKSGNLG